MKQYKITRVFANGMECKRTLHEVAKEITNDNPKMAVEINSIKKGCIWCGHAENIRFDLKVDLMKCYVQDISSDEYSITITIR
mgnify:CR=1 FL=1